MLNTNLLLLSTNLVIGEMGYAVRPAGVFPPSKASPCFFNE